tara:strand:+ start:2458 stop:2640 length:183 start_codon:yes stop_codon:yes gene_type:complete
MPKLKKENELDTLLNLKQYLQQQLNIIDNSLYELEKSKMNKCENCSLEFKTKTMLKKHKC